MIIDSDRKHPPGIVALIENDFLPVLRYCIFGGIIAAIFATLIVLGPLWAAESDGFISFIGAFLALGFLIGTIAAVIGAIGGLFISPFAYAVLRSDNLKV